MLQTGVRLPDSALRARGAAQNPRNRFDRLAYVELPELEIGELADPDAADPRPLRTRFFDDPTRSLLARNQSPDVGFDVSINPYRGCEHGCVYCYARPTHEYLGLSAGLDFETRILVKRSAPEQLQRALASPRWKPEVIGVSGVTDAYQPVEQRLRLTRGCLEALVRFRNPVAIVTKSALIERDADLLARLASHGAAAVFVSVTTLDPELARRMEPRAPSPQRRLEAVRALARADVPVGVLVGPVIPGLTDHEAPALVEAAARSGAGFLRHILLRLPHGMPALFESWLERHYPERRAKVLSRIREIRGGRLNDPRFHLRHRGRGPYAEQIHALFALACRRAGLSEQGPTLSTAAFRRPGGPQLSLFARAGGSLSESVGGSLSGSDGGSPFGRD
jgi:DNA repair photolyase